MDTVTVHIAKTTLSKLLLRVEQGEEIILARGREPVAKLVPFRPPAQRLFGALKGVITVPADITAPLPDGELELWNQ